MKTIQMAPDRHPVLNKVMSAVSWASGVGVQDILGERRTATIARARQVCFYLAHKNTGLSDREIAAYLNKERTTVLFGRTAIENRLSNRYERELQQLVARAQKQLENLLATPDDDGSALSVDALLDQAEEIIRSARSEVAAGMPRIARARLIAVSKLVAETQFMLGELEAITLRSQAYLPHAG